MAAEFTLLYDSQCPFCRREVDWLKRRDHGAGLAVVDITRPEFDPARFGLTREEVVAELCGVLPDGRVTRGLESMRRAWGAVGLGWIMAPTAWPPLRPLCDVAYRLFARHRVRLGRLFGRRCDDRSCTRESGAGRRANTAPP